MTICSSGASLYTERNIFRSLPCSPNQTLPSKPRGSRCCSAFSQPSCSFLLLFMFLFLYRCMCPRFLFRVSVFVRSGLGCVSSRRLVCAGVPLAPLGSKFPDVARSLAVFRLWLGSPAQPHQLIVLPVLSHTRYRDSIILFDVYDSFALLCHAASTSTLRSWFSPLPHPQSP